MKNTEVWHTGDKFSFHNYHESKQNLSETLNKILKKGFVVIGNTVIKEKKSMLDTPYKPIGYESK